MDKLQKLIDIVAKLRGPGGCPWDQAQTMESICTHIIEEAYEWVSTIQSQDMAAIQDEAGDVLLHVLMISQIASESNGFCIDDVVETVTQKMIRRHPHVFGNESAQTEADVKTIWEKVKSKEKQSESAFDRIPKGISSLMKAEKLQKVAAKAGFEFPSVSDAISKMREELDELESAIQSKNQSDVQEEMGDLLFSLVNVSRLLKVPTEPALTACNLKFKKRFDHMQTICDQSGESFTKLSLDQKEALWQKSKTEL